MTTLPTGTVTLLVTEIEDGAQLWEKHGSAMQAAHRRQGSILAAAVESNGGYAFRMIGDSFQAAFPTAAQAVQAALDAQRALKSEEWGEVGAIRVRMALHSGVVEEGTEDYSGPLPNRAKRLLSAGHGGQMLLSEITYELVRDTLPGGVTVHDLGEHRLKDMTQRERIFQLAAGDLTAEFPPLKSIEGYPNNLPLQSTPFIGRGKQVADVQERLLRPDVRVLTLTGPGGIGKTRLAMQAAEETLADFSDGVFFVNLTPVVDAGLVPATIAHTLGLQETGGELIGDTLKEYLRDKQILLVLDNLEQVIEAASDVAGLINAAPQLKVLVTSRAPLRISAEHEYQVPALEARRR
jgi:class 3 adenylate cyclase